MADKTSIKKIEFNVHGKKLELTADEAKELKQILSDLFGETKVVHEWRTIPNYPYTWPYATWSCGTISGISNASTLTNATATTSDTLYLTVK